MSVVIIRRALPRDKVSISEIAISAYSVYLDRMNREPFPMLEDYAARIGAGQAYVLEDGVGICGYTILVFRSHDTLLLDNMGVRPECQSSVMAVFSYPGQADRQNNRQKMDCPVHQ